MEKSMVLWKNLWNFGLLSKNNGTIEKKLWHDAKNYCTIVVVCRFVKRATE